MLQISGAALLHPRTIKKEESTFGCPTENALVSLFCPPALDRFIIGKLKEVGCSVSRE